MTGGRIAADISGKEREGLTVEGLTEMFRAAAGSEFANDRMLLY